MNWVTAWEHEKRGPDGKWTKGNGINIIGSTTVLARQLAAKGHGIESIRSELARARAKKAKQWEFIGPHGSMAGAAFLPGNVEPQIGDMARDGHGGVGRVISKGGGHVVLDADDGNRYLVDWRNGGNVVKQLPLGDAKWNDPRAALPKAKVVPGVPVQAFRQPGGGVLKVGRDPNPPNPAYPYLVSQDGGERHVAKGIADQLRGVQPPPSPPGQYVAPGQKQLYLPGTEKMPTGFGEQSPEVRKLRSKWDQALQAIDDGNARWPEQGIQGDTAVVTLPGKRGKVVVKRNLRRDLADREELAGYVGQAIGMEHPPIVARTGPTDLIEDYVSGKTAERFLAEKENQDDGTDWEYELANTPEGHNIGILDTLVSNTDRHSGNWMVTRNAHPRAIDMSFSMFDGEDRYSPFRGNEEDEDPERLAKIRDNLIKIEPEFNRLGHHDWWAAMMDRMTKLQMSAEANAESESEEFSNITSQVGISLAGAGALTIFSEDGPLGTISLDASGSKLTGSTPFMQDIADTETANWGDAGTAYRWLAQNGAGYLAAAESATELASWVHETRAPDGRWVHGIASQVRTAPAGKYPAVDRLASISEDELKSAGSTRPVQGIQGSVKILHLPGGPVVDKTYKDFELRSGDVIPAAEMADKDELAYFVSNAIGAGVPAVQRRSPDRILMGYAGGETLGEYLQGFKSREAQKYQEHHDTRRHVLGTEIDADIQSDKALRSEESRLFDSPEAVKIGLLDYLTGNRDRHMGNLIVKDSKLIPIDHSSSRFDGEPGVSSVFIRAMKNHDYELDLSSLRQELSGTEPEFTRLGHHDYYENMMHQLDNLEGDSDADADADFSNITAQIELGWRFNPLELRDAHGRWTKSGASYVRPDPSRLFNPRSKQYPNPGDHPFFQANPVSAANVVASYLSSSEGHRRQGMRWYADARTLAGEMGDGDLTKAAGVTAAYSPQTGWAVNMINAARALHENRALGPGDGMITGTMQANAARALGGAPLDEVLTSPKTNAFGHLIANGGDHPDDTLGKVVIDRHAMSVAVGRRLTKKEVESSPIGKDRFYQHVADAYRDAAADIREREGIDITPHQLQAITWLHQQELNEDEDQAAGAADPLTARLQRGRETSRRNAWARWAGYDWANKLPSFIGTTAMPGNAIAPEVRSSPAGFSISALGTGKMPTTGFMVAQTDHTHTFPASVMDDDRKLADAIDEMLLAESDSFGEGTYLGGWVHDGKLWLEPSDNVSDPAEAQRMAAERNQIAIWDVANGRELSTGGTGGGQIFEHANAQGDHGRTGGLRQPARARAQGGSPGHRAEAQAGIAAQLRSGGITEQLDLTGDGHGHHIPGTPDVYRHGWIPIGPQAAGSTEVKSIHDRMLDAVKQESNDDTKTKIIMAGVALDNGDYSGAADWMTEAALDSMDRSDGKWKPYKQLADDLNAEAKFDGGKRASARDDATKLAAKTAPSVPGMLGGGKEAWNGKLTLFSPADNPGVGAQIDWNGNIDLQAGLAHSMSETLKTTGPVSDMQPFITMLHELIHGTIPENEKYSSHESAYQNPDIAAIEEGFTELGAIHHAPEYFGKAGIGDRETLMLSDPLNPYPSGKTRHATTAEYARRVDNPVRIASGDAWGHYGWQTKQAQDWVQQVAHAEGHGSLGIGTPGWSRMHELADEINRQGPAGKTAAMALQITRASGVTPDASGKYMGERDWAALMDSINLGWASNVIEQDGAKNAFRRGQHQVTRILAAREAAA